MRRVRDAAGLSGGEAAPGRYVLYGAVMAWGFAYPFSNIDIIPNRLPIVGYLDQVASVALGLAAMWLVMFRRPAVPQAIPDDGATLAVWAPGLGRKSARRIGSAARLRNLVLDGFARMLAAPLLRLSMGSWPNAAETSAFRRGFRRFAPVPPLLRALASVPAARHQVMRTMLISWMLADERYRDEFRDELGSTEPHAGDRLQVWSGPKVTFLHLEKTAGMSVTSVLTARFHPMQIDPDPRRSFPPHVLCPLPPFLVERVKRYALVWGHYDVPSIRRLGQDRFVFTMLREPRARILSLYTYWRSTAAQDVGWAGMNQPVLAAQSLPLLAFLQSDDPVITDHIDNFYVRRFTGAYRTGCETDPLQADPAGCLEQALDALAGFDFVGLTEDTSGAMATLAERLGFPPPDAMPRVNVTRVSPEPSPEEDPAIAAALDRLTALDRVVYDAVRRRADGQGLPDVHGPQPRAIS